MNPDQRSSLIWVYNVYNIGNQKYKQMREQTPIYMYIQVHFRLIFFAEAKNMTHDQTAPTLALLKIVPL